MKTTLTVALLLTLTVSFASAANAAPPTSTPVAPASGGQSIYQTTSGSGSKDWSSYETDSAPGSISAAGMLGVSGGAITNVESVKDVSAAINSLTSGGGTTGLALSFTPARSAISPMTQQTYVNGGFFTRLIGSTTLGYAKNDTTISSATYHQQAASIQASGFFNEKEDPVVGLFNALRDGKYGCGAADIISQPSEPPVFKPGTPSGGSTDAPAAPADVVTAQAAKWATCKANIAKTVPWNPSTYSIGFGTGWINPATGGGSQGTLGRTLFIGAQYGFLNPRNNDGTLDATSSNGMLVALAYRASRHEPVLNTIGTSTVTYQNSNLWYGKLSGGNNTLRGLIEYNNTKTTNVTQSQLALKAAVGFDFQLAKNTWISFRYGKQNTVNGNQTQNGSLFNVSYSPAALLSN